MNSIDFLWTTDPGLATIGILIVAIVFLLVAYFSKFNIAVVIIDIVLWLAVVATAGAVLGIWELPFLDYFNVIGGGTTP